MTEILDSEYTYDELKLLYQISGNINKEALDKSDFGQIMTGSQFNSNNHGLIFVKPIHDSLNLINGLNVKSFVFDSDGKIIGGGHYIVRIKDSLHFINNGFDIAKTICRVIIPSDANVHSVNGRTFVDKLVLSEPIAIELFVRSSLITDQIIMESVRTDPSLLGVIPMERRTHEMNLIAVKSDGYAICAIPIEDRTEEIYLAAIKKSFGIIEEVPNDKLTYQFAMSAVKLNGRVIQHVPVNLLTEVMCVEAIENDSSALALIPRHMRTNAVCYAALKNSW